MSLHPQLLGSREVEGQESWEGRWPLGMWTNHLNLLCFPTRLLERRCLKWWLSNHSCDSFMGIKVWGGLRPTEYKAQIEFFLCVLGFLVVEVECDPEPCSYTTVSVQCFKMGPGLPSLAFSGYLNVMGLAFYLTSIIQFRFLWWDSEVVCLTRPSFNLESVQVSK